MAKSSRTYLFSHKQCDVVTWREWKGTPRRERISTFAGTGFAAGEAYPT